MKSLGKKAFRFIVSGGSAAGTALALFYLFFHVFGIWYLSASVISFILSTIVGFYMQKYYTFKEVSKSTTKKQATLFLTVSLVNLLINTALMSFFVGFLLFDALFAKVLTLGILACWNFFVYQRFVFRETITKK